MEPAHLPYLIAAVLAVVTVIELCARGLSRWWRRLAARRRQRRAVRGERRAERLLERRGFTICERQANTTWTIHCDGKAHQVPLRADLVVERDGERFVAEVKTGRIAPRLETAATRRQLLEYLVAYDVAGVLLVDAEANRVMEVEFPLSPSQASGQRFGRLMWTLSGLCIGVAIGMWAATW